MVSTIPLAEIAASSSHALRFMVGAFGRPRVGGAVARLRDEKLAELEVRCVDAMNCNFSAVIRYDAIMAEVLYTP